MSRYIEVTRPDPLAVRIVLVPSTNFSRGGWPDAAAIATVSARQRNVTSAPPSAASIWPTVPRRRHVAGAHQHHPFLPHLLQDGRAEPRIEAGALQLVVERTNALSEGAVPFAVGQRLQAAGELDDAAVSVERRRDHTEAAEHGRLAEPLHEKGDVPHAVEGRQNHGLPPNCGGKVVERALEPESLDRQQYDVERLGRRARDEQARLYTK